MYSILPLSAESSIADADAIFKGCGFRHLPVADAAGRIAGIVSDRDVLRATDQTAAIGDVIQTSSQFADSRSLPVANPRSMVAFTHTSEAQLPAGCVINVGLASAKFGGQGGGFQAEHVSGPAIEFTQFTGRYWHGRAGHA